MASAEKIVAPCPCFIFTDTLFRQKKTNDACISKPVNLYIRKNRPIVSIILPDLFYTCYTNIITNHTADGDGTKHFGNPQVGGIKDTKLKLSGSNAFNIYIVGTAASAEGQGILIGGASGLCF